MQLPPVKDLLVKTNNPDYLDKSVNHFGAAVVGNVLGKYTKVDDAYIVRCFGNVSAIKFVIGNQGCGKVVREFEELYNDDAFEEKPQ